MLEFQTLAGKVSTQAMTMRVSTLSQTIRTFQLQKWYAANGDSGLQSLSGPAGDGNGRTDQHRLIKEMTDSLFKDDQALSG